MAMPEDRLIGAMEGTEEKKLSHQEQQEKHEEQKAQEAFKEFETRIAEIRATLSRAGHLELVADGRFMIEKKELIEKVGLQKANRFMSDFFSKNSVN